MGKMGKIAIKTKGWFSHKTFHQFGKNSPYKKNGKKSGKKSGICGHGKKIKNPIFKNPKDESFIKIVRFEKKCKKNIHKSTNSRVFVNPS